MWKEKPQATLKECAMAAGLPVPIHMLSEPESAITYALSQLDPGLLKDSETFVCCDAGGGTVDLISYTIEELGKGEKVKISEAAEGMGDTCGSSFINIKFRQLLLDRFGADEDFEDDTLQEAMAKFEQKIKRDFYGGEEEVHIPVPGLSDNSAKGVKRNRLRLSRAEMECLFEPSVIATTVLVKAQVKKTKKTVKAILLVGGFGQSPYLRKKIQEVVGPEIPVLQPPNGDTAIVRGALEKGLALCSPTLSKIQVSSRIAQRYYGVHVQKPFNPRLHKRKDRLVSPSHSFQQILTI